MRLPKAQADETSASALLKGFVEACLDGRIALNQIGAIDPVNLDERIAAVIEQTLVPKIEKMEQRLGKLRAA